jgi:hypothetical protein
MSAGLWRGNEGRGNFEDLGTEGRILLNRSKRNQKGWAYTGFVWVWIGTGRAIVGTMMNIRVS